jgi:hypothetical protein
MLAHDILHSTLLTTDVIAITGSAFFLAVSFNNTRARPRWSKGLLLLMGATGIALYSLKLAIDAHWILFQPRTSDIIHEVLDFINGCLVGWLSALIVSGQLSGKTVEKCEGLAEKKTH